MLNYGIRILNSSPYNAQANGHPKSTNNIWIWHIKRKLNLPRRWHEVVSEASWANRISRHAAIEVTPYVMIYGQEVVLPVEVDMPAFRFPK